MMEMTPGIRPMVCRTEGRLRIPMPTWLVKKMRVVCGYGWSVTTSCRRRQANGTNERKTYADHAQLVSSTIVVLDLTYDVAIVAVIRAQCTLILVRGMLVVTHGGGIKRVSVRRWRATIVDMGRHGSGWCSASRRDDTRRMGSRLWQHAPPNTVEDNRKREGPFMMEDHVILSIDGQGRRRQSD